ncbi:UNVERIFIED_CONTAM: hypothetical protein FKN15_002497 [Acipenser sinensis]
MKWKTVLAIFVVVVAYLVTGGLVFRALEQPFESNQKNTIALEKSEFLQKHPCVKSGELEALIQVGEIKAHAAEWKASVRAEFRETRRRMSTDIHDKLQRAATMRSMERRRLGLDQRAHSLDMLSPEKRAVFASLDTDRFKTSSQESIDAKLNNLRLRMSEQYDQQGSSEDNIFNRFSSLTRLAKRNKNKDLKKNIPDDVKKIYENFGSCSTDEEKREDEQEKECNTSVPDIENTPRSELQNGSIPNVTKEYDNK